MEDVNKRRRISFSLSKLECGPQEINSREIRLHLPFSANWNKRDKDSVEKREFILKLTFSLPLPSSMLKLPIIGSTRGYLYSARRRYCTVTTKMFKQRSKCTKHTLKPKGGLCFSPSLLDIRPPFLRVHPRHASIQLFT